MTISSDFDPEKFLLADAPDTSFDMLHDLALQAQVDLTILQDQCIFYDGRKFKANEVVFPTFATLAAFLENKENLPSDHPVFIRLHNCQRDDRFFETKADYTKKGYPEAIFGCEDMVTDMGETRHVRAIILAHRVNPAIQWQKQDLQRAVLCFSPRLRFVDDRTYVEIGYDKIAQQKKWNNLPAMGLAGLNP